MIDYVVDPTTVPGKPAPDIFLKAAEGLELEPSQCIGVEDARAGIEAIKKAGMYSVGIGDKAVLTEANVVYKEPKDIKLKTLMF